MLTDQLPEPLRIWIRENATVLVQVFEFLMNNPVYLNLLKRMAQEEES